MNVNDVHDALFRLKSSQIKTTNHWGQLLNRSKNTNRGIWLPMDKGLNNVWRCEVQNTRWMKSPFLQVWPPSTWVHLGRIDTWTSRAAPWQMTPFHFQAQTGRPGQCLSGTSPSPHLLTATCAAWRAWPQTGSWGTTSTRWFPSVIGSSGSSFARSQHYPESAG